MNMIHTVEPILILILFILLVAIILAIYIVGVFCYSIWAGKKKANPKYNSPDLIMLCIAQAIKDNRMSEVEGTITTKYLDALIDGETTRGNGNAELEELLHTALKRGLDGGVITAEQGLMLSAYLDGLEAN